MSDILSLDLAAELARIDRQRAELALSLGGAVDWTAPLDIPAELARIDAERARPLPEAPGIGTWSNRHAAAGTALAICVAGAVVVAGGGLAVAWWLPSAGTDVDPGLLAIGLGLLVLALARR